MTELRPPRSSHVVVAITYVALAWGMSFFFIRESLQLFGPIGVAFSRALIAAVILTAIPAARVHIDIRNHGPIVVLSLVWMALPMALFAIAEQHLESAIAGIINGSAPLFTAVVAAVLYRRLPRRWVAFGLLVGFVGVVLVCVPSIKGGGSNAGSSVLLVIAAVALYGIAFNVAGPLQRKYGALPVVMRSMWIAALILFPFGIPEVIEGTPEVSSVAALVALGAFSTGGAFVVFAWLSGRTDPTRASVATYLVPVVATFAGAVIGGENIPVVAYFSVPVVLLGAWIVQNKSR